MDFQKEKQDFLEKKDKSTKGSVDEDITELLIYINSLNNYYTTSSCSGRISLITSQEKKMSKFIFVSHKPCLIPEITQECWLMVEPLILHVRCKDLESANSLLKNAIDCGLGKSGLISIDKLLLEINSTERMANFLTPDLSKEYLEQINEIANKKLEKMKEKIDLFYKKIKN